jgi:hypothetical protein
MMRKRKQGRGDLGEKSLTGGVHMAATGAWEMVACHVRWRVGSDGTVALGQRGGNRPKEVFQFNFLFQIHSFELNLGNILRDARQIRNLA